MQPVTILENRQQRTGYSEGYSVGAASCTSVMLILYAIGAVVCGAIVYIPEGAFPPDFYQILAFVQGGLYLLTALIGLGTICKNTCLIVFFMITCILTALASLGGLGYYCFQIYLLAVVGIFASCQGGCLFIVIPVCVLALISLMAFISALAGSIYCCTGMSSNSGGGPPSTVTAYQSPAPYGVKY